MNNCKVCICLGYVHFISYFKPLGEILRPYVHIKMLIINFSLQKSNSMYLQSTCLVTQTICCPIFGSNMQYIQMLTSHSQTCLPVLESTALNHSGELFVTKTSNRKQRQTLLCKCYHCEQACYLGTVDSVIESSFESSFVSSQKSQPR